MHKLKEYSNKLKASLRTVQAWITEAGVTVWCGVARSVDMDMSGLSACILTRRNAFASLRYLSLVELHVAQRGRDRRHVRLELLRIPARMQNTAHWHANASANTNTRACEHERQSSEHSIRTRVLEWTQQPSKGNLRPDSPEARARLSVN